LDGSVGWVKILILLNDPPYGSERTWNGLRLAGSLSHRDDVEVRVFLFGDSVGASVAGQKVPDGYYHLGRMTAGVLRHGGQVACCGTCLDARGLTDVALVDGAERGTLDQCTDWTLWADKVISF
jgi:uncharacterized protein involved in oxidation of intracellular sulfur